MSPWTDAASILPADHEYVRFLVAGHTRPLLGVYENRSFYSRWGAYAEAQVKLWLKVGDAPHVPAPLRANTAQRYWSERPMREG
ncbi:MAG: hypothetical protein ACREPK_06365 [Rhodanobacteraceae bacterium]